MSVKIKRSKGMKIKRFFKYFGIVIAILVSGALVAGQITIYGMAEIPPPPGKMYSVNGGEIHMYCTGPENDKPTIIILSGAGTPSFLYSNLQEKLSETARTCSYDSAGIGWSLANDIPYTTKNLSNELYQLLQAAQINGPIILAGHSLGGITSLIYSAEHGNQVVGIAFIDSSHYNQMNHFGNEFRDKMDNQTDEMLEMFWLIELANDLGILSMITPLLDPSESEIDDEEHKLLSSFAKWNRPFPTMKSMISNLNLSFEQGKEAHYDRGDLPIISISASGKVSGGPDEIGGIPRDEYREGFTELHKDLAELSTNGRHVIVNGTDHISIVRSDETAEHILSLIPYIES